MKNQYERIYFLKINKFDRFMHYKIRLKKYKKDKWVDNKKNEKSMINFIVIYFSNSNPLYNLKTPLFNL